MPLLLTVLGIMAAVSLVAGVLLSFAGFTYGCLIVVRLFEGASERLGWRITHRRAGHETPRASATRAARWALGRSGLLFAALGLLALGTLVMIGLIEGVQWEDQVDVTAHRGSSAAAPENTLSAIRQAIADKRRLRGNRRPIDLRRGRRRGARRGYDADRQESRRDPQDTVCGTRQDRRGKPVQSRIRRGADSHAGRGDQRRRRGRIKLIVELKCYDKKPAPLAAAVVEKFQEARPVFSRR